MRRGIGAPGGRSPARRGTWVAATGLHSVAEGQVLRRIDRGLAVTAEYPTLPFINPTVNNVPFLRPAIE